MAVNLSEINTISRTIVNTHFANASTNRFYISQIALGKSDNLSNYSCLRLKISKPSEPFLKFFGADDLNRRCDCNLYITKSPNLFFATTTQLPH
jgi:hypothetical protein